jgi:hypothetical protein
MSNESPREVIHRLTEAKPGQTPQIKSKEIAKARQQLKKNNRILDAMSQAWLTAGSVGQYKKTEKRGQVKVTWPVSSKAEAYANEQAVLVRRAGGKADVKVTKKTVVLDLSAGFDLDKHQELARGLDAAIGRYFSR